MIVVKNTILFLVEYRTLNFECRISFSLFGIQNSMLILSYPRYPPRITKWVFHPGAAAVALVGGWHNGFGAVIKGFLVGAVAIVDVNEHACILHFVLVSGIGKHNTTIANADLAMHDEFFVAHRLVFFYTAKNIFGELEKRLRIFNNEIRHYLLVTFWNI